MKEYKDEPVYAMQAHRTHEKVKTTCATTNPPFPHEKVLVSFNFTF